VRTRKLLLTLFLPVVLVGCGQSSSTSDFDGAQQDVAEVVEDLQEAGTRDEPERICDEILARPLRTRDCRAKVDEALKDADTFELDVKSVRISGATARARVESGRDGDQVETIELVREGQDWRISRLAGAAPAR
jgi:hypothetical protein